MKKTMTQLIINGITLPETSHNRYRCYPAELGTQLDMISGRRVSEIRGNVQMVHYEYDYLGDAIWRPLAAALRSGRSMTVQYLPDDGSELITGIFLRESLQEPSFAFSRHGRALWHGIAFTLREVRPHD